VRQCDAGAAYAAGEQIISRAIIEEVPENLDLLPRNENLPAGENKIEPLHSVRKAGRTKNEMLQDKSSEKNKSNYSRECGAMMNWRKIY
jgi:microcompartment protein CcmL/EutN